MASLAPPALDRLAPATQPALLLARQAAAVTGLAAVVLCQDTWLVPLAVAPAEQAGALTPLSLVDPALAGLAPVRAMAERRPIAAPALSTAFWSVLTQPHIAYPLVVGEDVLGLLVVAGPGATEPALLPRLADLAALGAHALAARAPTGRPHRDLLALYDLSRMLTTAPRHDLLAHLARTIAGLLAVRVCLIQLPDAAHHLVIRAHHGLDAGNQRQSAPYAGDAGWAYLHGQPRLVNAPALNGRGAVPGRRALYVPLIAGARTVGVLGVLDPLPDRPFTDDDTRLLATIGHGVAVAIEQERLLETASAAGTRLATMLEAIPDSVVTVDADLNLIEMNRAGLRQFRLPDHAAARSPLLAAFERLRVTKPDGSPATIDDLPIVQALRQGRPASAELHHHEPDGQTVIYQCQAAPLHDAATRLTGAMAVSRDVTEERRRAAHLRAVAQAARSVIGSLDLDQVVRVAVEQAATLLHADTAFLWLLEPNGCELRRAAAAGAGDGDAPPARLALAAPALTAMAGRRLEMQVVEEIATDGAGGLSQPAADEYAGAKSALFVPLAVRQRLVGVLTVMSRTPRRFHPTELQVVQTLANQFAIAIDNARLYGQAEAQRRWLTTIISGLPEGVVVADAATGAITAVNPAAARLLGLMLDDDRGAQVDSLAFRYLDGTPLPPDEQPLMRTLARGETCLAVELRHDPPVGEPCILLVNTAPLRDIVGATRGGVAVFQDITDLKAEQNQRDEFLSLASHELKTPLTSIKGYTELVQRRLAREGIGERHQRALSVVSHQIDRMTRLVNDLLDLSRLQTGRFTIEAILIDLTDVTKRVVETMRETAPLHRLQVTVPPRPARVRADAHYVEQVVTNLLSNAVKFSPEGSTVAVDVRVVGREAIVSVQDQGAGIPPERQARLFERYYRGHDTAGTGLGLGLYISHEIVARHGGRLWVHSIMGQGSTFSFALPLAAP